jgi:hypothetical protein
MMIDETSAQNALADLVRSGVWHWNILTGVAQAMSVAGKLRLDIVDFFWQLLNASPAVLDEEQLNTLDDFIRALLGDCRLDQLVRLQGDPEDPQALSELVVAAAARWRPPNS